jgi:hypothetical protein
MLWADDEEARRMFERWDEVELDLQVEATLALDEGYGPEPLLVAFDEQEPVGIVGLRPFEPHGVLQALVEVLALLLPLGARRLALTLPGQARDVPGSDPTPLNASGTQSPLVVLATADAVGEGPTRLRARVLPLAHDGDCWQWQEQDAVDIDADDWDITRALAVLLEAPAPFEAETERQRTQLQAQLGRCLLLGHMVTLAPPAADRLEPGRLAILDPLPLPPLPSSEA